MKPDPMVPFERLAALSRQETSSGVDVADRVLQMLHARRSGLARREPEYGLVGIGSLCAACAALVLFGLVSGDDSYVMLVQPFFTEMP